MIYADDPERAWSFDTDDGTRVFAVDDDKLAFYLPRNDSAYVASEDAVSLRNWR